MNKTFKIAFSIKNTYRVNTILYSLKQIPLIKRILPQELYCDPDLKLVGNIISGIGEFIKAFLGKFLFFLLMVTAPLLLYETGEKREMTLQQLPAYLYAGTVCYGRSNNFGWGVEYTNESNPSDKITITSIISATDSEVNTNAGHFSF